MKSNIIILVISFLLFLLLILFFYELREAISFWGTSLKSEIIQTEEKLIKENQKQLALLLNRVDSLESVVKDLEIKENKYYTYYMENINEVDTITNDSILVLRIKQQLLNLGEPRLDKYLSGAGLGVGF